MKKNEVLKTKKITKIDLLKKHLLKKKSITSWDAINLFRMTRLSAFIFILDKQGWRFKRPKIATEDGWYTRYILISSPND